jgi:NADPH:quinone reductase-like Zn-dependent oxidoreductase
MPTILRLHAYSGLEGLSLDDVPLQDPGNGEVRIRVHAFALNWGDMDLMENNYSFSFDELPARIGSEATGTIDAVGEDVSPDLVGTRVCTIPYFYGNQGVNGEFAIVPERFVTPAPEALSDVEACSVWMQYLTAYFPLVEMGNVGPNSTILITAATGSAGLAAIQLANYLGARTICTTRSEESRAYLKKVGANHVIVTTHEDVAGKLNEITHGFGVNLIYDPVGGDLVQAYAKALAQEAVIVIYGGISGQPTILPELEMTTKNAVLRPYSLMNYTARDDLRDHGVAFVSDAVERGDLRPIIDRSFALEDYREAFNYMRAARSSHGKIVITTNAA